MLLAENIVVQVDCTAVFFAAEKCLICLHYLCSFLQKRFSELFGIEHGNAAFYRLVLNVLNMSLSLGNYGTIME